MSIKKLSAPSLVGFSLTLLLVTQLFFEPLIPTLIKSEQGLSPYYAYALTIFSYFAITLIIFIEIKNLGEFYVDNIALWLFILSCFVRSRLGVNHEILYLLPIIVMGIVLFFQTIRNPTGIPQTNKNTIIGGVTLAFGVLIIVTIAESLQASKWLNPIYSNNIGITILRQSIFQLSFVVLIEEFIFRGLLTGYLLKLGLREGTSFTIQALLFWLIHYMRLGNPITFYISLPLLTWSTSFIVRRYKQLTGSIIIHMTINVFVGLFINIWF